MIEQPTIVNIILRLRTYILRHLLLYMIVLPAAMSCAVYNDVVLDNREHTVPCHELPTVAEVNEVINAHQDKVEEILAVNPGQVFLEVDTLTCPAKASLIISYPSHNNREEIEALIGDDTFFGVPYTLRNQ